MDRFVLTPEEKRVVVVVLAAFLLGLCTKYYRDTHPAPIPAKAQTNVWQSHRPTFADRTEVKERGDELTASVAARARHRNAA
jgi:hypothetical protein